MNPIDAIFAAADVSTLSTNYQALLIGFITLGMIALGYHFVTGGLKKGKRAA